MDSKIDALLFLLNVGGQIDGGTPVHIFQLSKVRLVDGE